MYRSIDGWIHTLSTLGQEKEAEMVKKLRGMVQTKELCFTHFYVLLLSSCLIYFLETHDASPD